jgi:hypothetical protein
MNHIRIAAIVEGQGEVEAVPILIRRIAIEAAIHSKIEINPILRVPANRLIKPGELERTVDLSARKLEGKGGIFVLIDCDWEDCCPKFDGPDLSDRATNARPDHPVSLVLANKEYESWFIAGAGSLQEIGMLSMDLEYVHDPENIRGAKEWISRHMPKSQPYKETLDQPALTQKLNLQDARRARSFDKCYREIKGLLERLASEPE